MRRRQLPSRSPTVERNPCEAGIWPASARQKAAHAAFFLTSGGDGLHQPGRSRALLVTLVRQRKLQFSIKPIEICSPIDKGYSYTTRVDSQRHYETWFTWFF